MSVCHNSMINLILFPHLPVIERNSEIINILLIFCISLFHKIHINLPFIFGFNFSAVYTSELIFN